MQMLLSFAKFAQLCGLMREDAAQLCKCGPRCVNLNCGRAKAEYRYSVVGSLRALGHKSDEVKKVFKLRLEEFRNNSTL